MVNSLGQRLHRLIQYSNHNADWALINWVRDKMEDCKIIIYVDASFAAELEDAKSIFGAYLVLIGPRILIPLTWFCKKQRAVHHFSSEAETIALEAALQIQGLPMLILREQILNFFLQPILQKPWKNTVAGGNPYGIPIRY